MGDGCILKRGAIQIEQGSKQKDYLLWKYRYLKDLVSVKPRKVFRTKKDGQRTHSYRFVLKQYFRAWRHKIYRNGQKVINDNLLKLLTPISLAVWYMDDGCLRSRSQLVICTDGFSKNSIKKLRNHLKKVWGIKTRLKLKREPKYRTYERITIGSHSMVRFFNLIRPHMAPSMLYKILDPLTTQSMRRVGKA